MLTFSLCFSDRTYVCMHLCLHAQVHLCVHAYVCVCVCGGGGA